MKNKVLIAIVLIAALIFSTIAAAAEPGTPPTAPTGPNSGSGPGLTAGSDNQPMKERLQEFNDDKDSFIKQKKACKEESMMTNAPQGTCWDKLKPVMIAIMMKEIKLTGIRLMQLRQKNITFSNYDEINATLNEAYAVLSDSSSSKEQIKSTAKKLEDLINQIEDEATKNQPKVLIAQMDNLMAKADSATKKMDSKLAKLKAAT
jgi:hypothetical protein